ncbi:MAG: pro-sigmaK processing inhibitor BofA family protein [Candidatus Desulforudis sp.]|nr:pro-sigmaK processing inhibitor BofA family protein [Desulforudis sp.]
MEWKLILLGLLGLAGLYLVGSFFVTPLKYLYRLGACVVVGVVLLALVNLGGSFFGFHLAINPVTVLTAGALQVPGVILLIVLTLMV